MITIHELKTDPIPFQAVWDRLKLAEIRRENDGFFEVGDTLKLRETKYSADCMSCANREHFPLIYTGRSVVCTVLHVQRLPYIPRGSAMLSIRVESCFIGERLANGTLPNPTLIRALYAAAFPEPWPDATIPVNPFKPWKLLMYRPGQLGGIAVDIWATSLTEAIRVGCWAYKGADFTTRD